MAEEQQPFLAPAYRDDPGTSDSIDQMQHCNHCNHCNLCNHCGVPVVSAADKKHRPPQAAAAAFTTTHHVHSLLHHHHHPHFHPAAFHAKRRKARLAVLSDFAHVFLGGALLVSRTAHRLHNEQRELREAVGLGEPAVWRRDAWAPWEASRSPAPTGKPPGRRPHPHPHTHPPKPSPPDEGEEPPESPPDDGEQGVAGAESF
ncbi:hypothetical protein DFJ73DRAFT_763773 [Zopfochytrium polystomum]|nr:hypothetical protein DFJ73DRAFT_763773 [Zopfochytrium polystomum]